MSFETEILSAVTGLRKSLIKNVDVGTGIKNIIEEDGRDYINLQISCCKLPPLLPTGHSRPMTIKISLPHSLVDDDTEVCLITKDLQRGIRKDHEPGLAHFQDLLREKEVLSLVNQVLTLRQLKVEYKEYEAKRNLAQRTDIMLVDDNIIRLIPKFLGKAFYSKKKHPVQINLKAKDLKKEMMKCLSLTHLHLTLSGGCSMVRVARTSQTDTEIVDNIRSVYRTLKKFPGGWKNIRTIHLKTNSSESIPLFVNFDEDPSLKVSHPNQDDGKDVVTGQVSTFRGKTVYVTPTGKVEVIIPSKRLKLKDFETKGKSKAVIDVKEKVEAEEDGDDKSMDGQRKMKVLTAVK